jgi:hypothetical protein
MFRWRIIFLTFDDLRVRPAALFTELFVVIFDSFCAAHGNNLPRRFFASGAGDTSLLAVSRFTVHTHKIPTSTSIKIVCQPSQISPTTSAQMNATDYTLSSTSGVADVNEWRCMVTPQRHLPPCNCKDLKPILDRIAVKVVEVKLRHWLSGWSRGRQLLLIFATKRFI